MKAIIKRWAKHKFLQRMPVYEPVSDAWKWYLESDSVNLLPISSMSVFAATIFRG